MACHAINMRMNKSPEEISRIAKLAAKNRQIQAFNLPHIRKKNIDNMKKRIENGTFHLLSGEIQSRSNKQRVENGTHNFQTEESKQRIKRWNDEKLKDGSHPFKNGVGAKSSRERIEKGTHHWQTEKHKENVSQMNKRLIKEGKHDSQKLLKCEFCNSTGYSVGFRTNHFKHCIENPNNDRIECKHCNKKVTSGVYKRYHGQNCKQAK